jgi:hypothetical protein
MIEAHPCGSKSPYFHEMKKEHWWKKGEVDLSLRNGDSTTEKMQIKTESNI